MKKLFTLLLAVMMIATMSVTAFAAEDSYENKGTGDYEIDISAGYQAGTASDEIISVDIVWGAMEFTYHDAVQGQWNPETHAFDGGEAAHWDAKGNTITVTNHSNSPVKASFKYTASNTAVTGSFNHDVIELPTAVNTAVENAPSGATTLTLAGTLTDATKGEVGTVTVTIENN